MEIKDEKLNDDLVPSGVQKLFDDRRRKRVNKSFGNSRRKLLTGGILMAVFTLVILYAILPVSRVRSVVITGNHYLNDDYIRSVSDTAENQIFYMNIPPLIAFRLKSDPLIEDAEVHWGENQSINIKVKEKKIFGYRYTDEAMILTTDNHVVPMKSEFLDVIARVPLISGFETEDQTRLLARAMNDVDQSIIEDISEIKQYDLGYDSQAICILMRNGGYFFSDYRGVSLVNQYYNIYANMRNKNQCVFAESIGGSDDEVLDTAYAKACPWDETAAEVEYWKDENGEIITNTYGDKVIKHYYEIKDKERPVDENGNPIPIPINREGFEEKDEDFELHYEAGFYRTGKLELPEGYEPPETEEESGEEVPEEESGDDAENE